MDGRTFDALVRTLSLDVSRRRVLRRLTGGGATMFLAARSSSRLGAQEDAVALGGACAGSEQCLQDGMGAPIICADNGVVRDGALTCCRESGCCLRDEDCCGDLLCAPSSDVCSYCARLPFPTKHPGEVCAETVECVPSVVGTVVCADNGIVADGSLTCCLEADGGCSFDAQCCGALLCLGNRCLAPGGDGRLAPGAACDYAGQCRQAGGETDCADNGIAGDGAYNCCRHGDGACVDGASCCGSRLCLDGVCR